MKPDKIVIRGAREHNLRHIDLDLPKRRLVVFTGPSGSGKSSLAFDTLFAEGQRRYVESLSVYARQFVGQLEAPAVSELHGLSPTIAIEQKIVSTNPRSTVGTITEIQDHLRVLYSKLGLQHCTSCGARVGASDPDTILRAVASLEHGTRFKLLAPLVRNRKGEFRDLFEELRRSGIVRARVDGEEVETADITILRKSVRHTIDAVVDRLVSRNEVTQRLRESVELGLRLGEGRLTARIESGPDTDTEIPFSLHNACEPCGLSFPALSHQSFSFNSPLGMCPTCEGLGVSPAMDPALVIPDPELTINGGALAPLERRNSRESRLQWRVVEGFCDHHGISRTTPWKRLPADQRKLVLHGVTEEESFAIKGRKRPIRTRFEGALDLLMRRFRTTESDSLRDFYGRFVRWTRCPDCDGTRLRSESRAVRFRDRSITDLAALSVEEALAFLTEVTLEGTEARLGAELLATIRARLRFLVNVGLGYLSLDRPGPTLSGGEAQRIRLAGQLGNDLTGVLYILDEPSIGLHQRDNDQLIATLRDLRDQGNTVIVVEHDRDTIEAADHVVDFGPGAGAQGGAIVFAGDPATLRATAGNLTGDYLAGRRWIEAPETRRTPTRGHIRIRGAHANNLKHIDVDIPIGSFTVVTGVSGAGKSTLVNDILLPGVTNLLREEIEDASGCDTIEGLTGFNKVIEIDQRPIGRTPRSNPATYTKVFDHIRDAFASLPEARMYGYNRGRFSFNTPGGRCETCTGAGVIKVEMNFLADVYIPCETCRGRRFNDATLRVRYHGHSIADVLAMRIDEAAELFEAYPKIRRGLTTLLDVGLGYLTLGQPSTTLSGGEAQRIKLSRELSKLATGDTLYILDEPTTGLHFDDIRRLLDVVQRLVGAGNTVVMIEHNLDVIRTADHLIDLGPEGGGAGGELIAAGTPEEVAAVPASHTGRYLATELQRWQTR